MPKLYLDTNILLDHVMNRQPFNTSADQLMLHIAQRGAIGVTSVINLVHTHYQLRRSVSEQNARQILTDLLIVIDVVEIPYNLAATALTNQGCKDFEDAVQWAICQHHRLDFLITRNQTDFPANSQPVVCDAETYLLHHAPPG
jgi:predicted nucleic acid-binding protein